MSTYSSRIGEFFDFVNERHLIWHRRFQLKKPFPWTDDPILLEYKFTNVYRELDRGTIFLKDGIGEYLNSPAENLFAITAYRMLNNVAFFEWMDHGIPNVRWDMNRFLRKLEQYDSMGKSVFSAAYRVICNTKKGKRRYEEYITVMQDLQANLSAYANTIFNAEDFEDFNARLQFIKHVGPFLAYEIATDLWNIDNRVREMYDAESWANIGPGALVGLSYIFPKEYVKLASQKKSLELVRRLRDEQEEYLAKGFPYWRGKALSLRNIEHSLCEYGKYRKVSDGEGKARPRFTPPILRNV